MALDMTSFQPALKQLYPEKRIENMVYKDNPFFALLAKDTNFYGELMKLPIKYGIPQGSGSNFTNAQANKTSSLLKAFLVTRSKEYALASIDNETIEASRNNSGAFIEAASFEIDGAIEAAGRNIAIALAGTGSGSIGQVSVGGTGTSIQLSQPEDVTNFEVGMKLNFSTADGGGSVKSGSVIVTNVNRDSGVITVSAMSAIAGGAGTANSDFIFRDGDYDSKLKGIRAWLPDTDPTSTPFFNVDRSVDPTRLAGVRIDGSAVPIEEALIAAAARVAREGGKPDYCFMNYSKFADLEKALGSKVQYIDLKANAEIGFRGILINGPRGPIKVVADQNFKADRAFMLSMEYWKLFSLGNAPRILDIDGLKLLRESSADAVEVRVGAYLQLTCRAPGFNANIYLG